MVFCSPATKLMKTDNVHPISMETMLDQKREVLFLNSGLMPASIPALWHISCCFCSNPCQDKKRWKKVLPEGSRVKKLLHSKMVKAKCLISTRFSSALGSSKFVGLISCHRVEIAKQPGYFLVVLLFISFCIRRIASNFGHHSAKRLKHGAVNESKRLDDRLNKWKSALCGSLEFEVINEESSEHSANLPADQSRDDSEGIFKAYASLEPSYLKFLSECGMTKWGYWRGGLSE